LSKRQVKKEEGEDINKTVVIKEMAIKRCRSLL
jgi:hypothetical protein